MSDITFEERPNDLKEVLFCDETRQVGRLSWKDGQLDFAGEATQSALIFVACVGAHLKGGEDRLGILQEDVKYLLRELRHSYLSVEAERAVGRFVAKHQDLNVD